MQAFFSFTYYKNLMASFCFIQCCLPCWRSKPGKDHLDLHCLALNVILKALLKVKINKMLVKKRSTQNMLNPLPVMLTGFVKLLSLFICPPWCMSIRCCLSLLSLAALRRGTMFYPDSLQYLWSRCFALAPLSAIVMQITSGFGTSSVFLITSYPHTTIPCLVFCAAC